MKKNANRKSRGNGSTKVVVAFSLDKSVAAELKRLARTQAETPKSAMVSGLVNGWAKRFVELKGNASMQKRG